MDNRKHAYFCKMQDETLVAKKVKYMKRVVGHGASGCRHSKFVAQPPIHEEETINPRFKFKEDSDGLYLKLYTKERLHDLYCVHILLPMKPIVNPANNSFSITKKCNSNDIVAFKSVQRTELKKESPNRRSPTCDTEHCTHFSEFEMLDCKIAVRCTLQRTARCGWRSVSELLHSFVQG